MKCFEKKSMISEFSAVESNDGHGAACMLRIYCKQSYVCMYQSIGNRWLQVSTIF